MESSLNTKIHNHIKNLLTQNQIPFSETGDFVITTKIVEISPRHIISQITGEILVEFNNTFGLGDFLDYLLPLISSHSLEVGVEGGAV